MKIRLKVKHLVLITASALASVLLMIFVIVPQINLYMTEKRLDKGNADAKEDIIKMMDGNILQSQKWKIIREYMLDDDLFYRFDVYVGPSFSSQSNPDDLNTHFTWSQKLPFIQEYVEKGPINGNLNIAAKNLSTYYEEKDQWKKAEQVLTDASKRLYENSYQYDHQELQLERGKLLLRYDEPQKAEQFLQEMTEDLNASDNHVKDEIAELHVETILRQGNLEEAHQEVKDELASFEDQKQTDPESYPETNGAYEQLQSLERHLSIALNQNGEASVGVSGKMVGSNGEPVKNAGVFLRKEYEVNSSVSEDEPYQTTTDENGHYEIRGVVPGNYQVSLGFTFDQIDGWTWPVEMDDWVDIDGSKDITYNITLNELMDIKKPVNKQKVNDETVHFAWEEVEGAAYYNLNVGMDIDSGSASSGLKTHLKETQLDVPIEELYDQHTGIMFGDKEESVDPLQLLGFTNPENRFSWSVEAYDSDDNLITSSDGYRLNEETIGNLPFFFLQERELTEADHLLLDKKEEAALSAYMENHEDNPDDLHSLRMISRLIGMKGDGTVEERDELAHPYIKELAKRTESEQYVTELVEYYYDHREWSALDKCFDQYSDLVDGHSNEYMQGIYANALMQQVKLHDAREAFKKTMKMDDSNRFVGNWLAVDIYLDESFSKALEIAKTNPERPLGDAHRNWEEMITNLKDEGSSHHSNDYFEELKDTLELYFEDNEEKLSEWIETTDNKAMKSFIKALQEIE